MPTLIGEFLGGLIAVYFFATLWEFLLFKRVMDDPVTGKIGSVVAGWLTAGTLAGFGFAHGGPFYSAAYLVYLAPALVIGAFSLHRGVKLRREAEEETEAGEAFE
jgi:hypothetical protein